METTRTVTRLRSVSSRWPLAWMPPSTMHRWMELNAPWALLRAKLAHAGAQPPHPRPRQKGTRHACAQTPRTRHPASPRAQRPQSPLRVRLRRDRLRPVQKWKQNGGGDIISLSKENMKLEVIGVTPIDRSDANNAGVTADELVTTSQHVAMPRRAASAGLISKPWAREASLSRTALLLVREPVCH